MSGRYENYDWSNYYQVTSKREGARDHLRKSIEISQEPGQAIDLGFGAGNETIALLKAGWKVYAVERELKAKEFLLNRIQSASYLTNLSITCCDFRDLPTQGIPLNQLTHASFSLPFLDNQSFTKIWSSITAALSVGGIFTGTLFGDRDEWSDDTMMTFHTKEEIMTLFQGFSFVLFDEWNGPKPTATGDTKDWHYFTIIARKEENDVS